MSPAWIKRSPDGMDGKCPWVSEMHTMRMGGLVGGGVKGGPRRRVRIWWRKVRRRVRGERRKRSRGVGGAHLELRRRVSRPIVGDEIN